jgi:hypothetical protein
MSLNEHWDKFYEDSLSKASAKTKDKSVVTAFKMAFFLGSASTFIELGKIGSAGFTAEEGAAAVKVLRDETGNFMTEMEKS